MANAILRGKPDAGNPHVRFDEGEVASAKPRRGSLLYKKRMMTMVLLSMMAVGFAAMASTINVSGGGDALQKAIDEAKAGDVLLVGPGAYSAIDTQGKEIEIRSTKGPKQTFLKTGSFSKSFGVIWGIGRTVKFAALLVSDKNTELWGDENSGYSTEVQWSEWDATQLPHSTLVGFTIQGSAINGDDCFTVNGGRIVNCILTDASIHAAEAEGCLFVCPTRNDGELVCDSRLVNCTVVVGGSSRCGEEVYCSELINTIVYALNGEVDIAWSSIIQPRMLNSVCYNIKRLSSEGHPMDLSGIRETDPLFVDRTTGDYRLTAASPCVDRGTNELSRAAADLNGGARIVNGTVDIGAYEFGSEYSWVENPDGAVTITEIRGEVPDVLALPSELGGRPVSAIGPGVLAGDEKDGVVPSIKTLIVPEGVRRIGEDSFSRCPYLAKIVLPKSLEEIGEGAFTAGADSLPFNDYKWKDYENFGIREIQVADGNESFEVKDGVLVDRKNRVAVVCCVNATSVSLPEGVSEIGEHCFAYCQSLSAIWFSSSLQTLGKEAFLFCRQLKALDFSNTSLSQVGKNAFCGCVNLAGVKFPASLEDVGKNAFYWCTALRSVTYEGDAPSSAEEIYMTSNDDLATPRLLTDAQRKEMLLSQVVSYVPSDSTGWGEVPGVWQGCPVRHEPRIDLEHNYAFETGAWNGWTYAEMEDYRSHDYSGEEGNPWVFNFGDDQLQNIAIPVYECGTDRIRPVIVLGTASESDKLTAFVLTEQEMANKFGIGKYRFERDDDEWEYEDERSKVDVCFPDSAWPELKLVADRQWIVISMANVNFGPHGFFSPKTFVVGIQGTDLVTPLITIMPDEELPSTTGFTPKNIFGLGVILQNDDSDGDDCFFEPSWGLWASGQEPWGYARVPYIFDTDDEGDAGYLMLTAPGKGVVYIKFGRDWYPGEDVDHPEDMGFSGAVLDGEVSVIEDGGEWWEENVWCALKTTGQGKIKISGYGEKLYVDGIWFKPDDVDLCGCLGTTAWYREDVQLANERRQVCYRCYVTGMGVTKFGDKATLVCHPNEGEVFDHWEFENCEAPVDATLTSPTLTFTATKDLYDQIEGIDGVPRCVAVRPVLKTRHQIAVIPVPCGAATVDGNGYYFEGDEATVSLAAAEGCQFRSWGDGAGNSPTRVFSVEKDMVVYAYFDGLPVVHPLEEVNSISSIVDPAPTAEEKAPLAVADVTKAQTFNGYLTNVAAEVVGSVTVKVAKNGKVTATVKLPDGAGSKALKTFGYAGTLGEGGRAELSCGKNGGRMVIDIGKAVVSGTVAQNGGTYGITGRIGTKEALKAVDSLKGKVWSVALTAPTNGVAHPLMRGCSVLTVTAAKQGKVKVAGFLADGTKVSANVQGLVFGSDTVVVPLNVALYKGKTGGFSLKLMIEGDKLTVGNVSEWTAVFDGKTCSQKWDAAHVSSKSALADGAAFCLDATAIPDDVLRASEDGTSVLPTGVVVRVTSGKWKLPKAGKVTLTKDKADLDVEKFTAKGETEPNPAALKLTYAAKAGTFKGSFALYGKVSETKLKKVAVTVNGVVVNGVGYGSAVIKKTASMPVTVEWPPAK